MIRYLNFIEGTSTSGFLEVTEVETLPYAPLSHPLVIRFIGTIRQEYLNHGPFWNAHDLRRKLCGFRKYYITRVFTVRSTAVPPTKKPALRTTRSLAWTFVAGKSAAVVCIT